MNSTHNDLGQPVGVPVLNWKPAPFPQRQPMAGQYCRLEPLDLELHAVGLYAAFAPDIEGRIWTYLPYGPFASFSEFRGWLELDCLGEDPLFFAVTNQDTGRLGGLISYLRVAPAAGSIEVGHVLFSQSLRQTRAATEAQFLMMRHAFELGYRRYEWKCDALNAPSRAAAERLGFSYEGVFRQATVYKNRNRDTAWFAVIDREWPTLHTAFQAWLRTDNFDAAGQQRGRLASRTAHS